MESSNVLNCTIGVKKKPIDVSLIENNYNMIDKTLDIKDFQFFGYQQENLVQKSDENQEGELDEIAIEFECKDVNLHVDLLTVAKIENWAQNYFQKVEDKNGHQTQNKIIIASLGAVKKESFVDDAKQLNMNLDCEFGEQNKKRTKAIKLYV
ncbi:hypothetical protein TKK_0012571 [Trichogramma kaykai]